MKTNIQTKNKTLCICTECKAVSTKADVWPAQRSLVSEEAGPVHPFSRVNSCWHAPSYSNLYTLVFFWQVYNKRRVPAINKRAFQVCDWWRLVSAWDPAGTSTNLAVRRDGRPGPFASACAKEAPGRRAVSPAFGGVGFSLCLSYALSPPLRERLHRSPSPVFHALLLNQKQVWRSASA